jgi:hypothetical protein
MNTPAIAACFLIGTCVAGNFASAKPAKKGPKPPSAQQQQLQALLIGSRPPSAEVGDFLAAHLDKFLAALSTMPAKKSRCPSDG